MVRTPPILKGLPLLKEGGRGGGESKFRLPLAEREESEKF